MNAPIYDIFFTGSTDPRRCIMIGGIGGIESAVYLEFRTLTVPSVETTTTVSNHLPPGPDDNVTHGGTDRFGFSDPS